MTDTASTTQRAMRARILCAAEHGWRVVAHSESEAGTVREAAASMGVPVRVVIRALPRAREGGAG